VAPDHLDMARAVLEVAAREGWRVLPAGAGEHLGRAAIGAADLVLSARRLRAITEYEPAEMVVEVEAGTTLHDLEACVAPHGQRLGCDAWPGRAANLGGAVAGNRFGLNRRRAGTLRDALLGARVLHADGTVSKTGGRVVKNVAGYDLGKLYVGSCGSLAFIHRMHLRLVPRPETSALVVAPVEREGAAVALAAVHGRPSNQQRCCSSRGTLAEAASVPAGKWAVVARFEGHAAAVRQQVEIAPDSSKPRSIRPMGLLQLTMRCAPAASRVPTRCCCECRRCRSPPPGCSMCRTCAAGSAVVPASSSTVSAPRTCSCRH
jgi:glycolate oxidase FAD binding subunit